MNNDLPRGYETVSAKFLSRLTILVLIGSFAVSLALAVTPAKRLTDMAPWIPGTIGIAMSVHIWALRAWMRWGQRRRTSGRRSIFGRLSRVGATDTNDYFSYHVLLGMLVCSVGGALSPAAVSGSSSTLAVFMAVIVVPLMWGSFAAGPLDYRSFGRAFLAVFLAASGMMLLALPGSEFRSYSEGTRPLAPILICTVLGLFYSVLSVFWHAERARDLTTPTESNTR